MGTMITSMELDEETYERAAALSGKKTKKAMLDEVLRVYVKLHEQAEVRRLRGKLLWKGDDLDAVREAPAEPARKGGGRANRR